jgi:HEAT repeat protein
MQRLIPVLIIIISTAGGFAADPAGFYDFEVIHNPDRTYFDADDGDYELSDSEYGSLKPGPRFLRYILSTWQDIGYTEETYFKNKTPKYTPDVSIRTLSNFLLNSRDPLARSNLVMRLMACNNPIGQDLLKKLLAIELDAYVTADILKAFRLLETSCPESETYLTHEDPDVRREAVQLYAQQANFQAARLLELAGNESQLPVVEEIWGVLAQKHAGTSIDDWKPQLDVPNPTDRALAIVAIMGYPNWTMMLRKRFVQFAGAGHPLVRTTIADNLSTGLDKNLQLTLLRSLINCEHTSVRAAAAAAIGRLEAGELLPGLLKLSRDPAPIVRRRAAIAMGSFPQRDTYVRLIELCGDSGSELLRDAALDTLENIADKYPVEREADSFLDSKNADIRYNLYRLLSRLDSSMHNEPIGTQLRISATAARQKLPYSDRPINIAAAIRALNAGGAREAAADITALKEHPDALVRTAIAESIGMLKPANGPDIVKHFAQQDHDTDVRKAALTSMNAILDNSFEDTLLKILKRTNYGGGEFLTASDRVIAAWMLSRLPTIGAPTKARLYAHITTPVVSTPMGPAFDSENVRNTALWCLTINGKRYPNDAELQKQAKELFNILIRDVENVGTIPTSYVLNYYAYQARQFLNDAPIERRIVKPQKYKFNYRPAKKRRNR